MKIQRRQFEDWYKKILKSMYPKEEAGFAILMIAFPLLERYIRVKTSTSSDSGFTEKCYLELLQVLPELDTVSEAEKFWQIFRNGILHEVNLSGKKRSGAVVPVGTLSQNTAILKIESSEHCINPNLFAQRVIRTIEDDFTNFEDPKGILTPLPTVKKYTDPSGITVTGTNTQP
jgi:hypothetical protein